MDYPRVSDILPERVSNQYAKFIKPTNIIPREAGMVGRTPITQLSDFQEIEPTGMSGGMNGVSYLDQNAQPQQQSFDQSGMRPAPSFHPSAFAQPQKEANCIDIARHIQECMICAKIHNNDMTVYIGVIVLLSIIFVILFKRCIES